MIGGWLLDPSALAELETAARATPTSSQLEAFTRGAPPPLRVEGSTAHVNVVGILTARPSILTTILGGTPYTAISAALDGAARDPAVRQVEMFVDSPGGQVSGLFELLAELENYPKPIKVKASLAASAAYALAAVVGPIEALGPASVFGSIGVATRVQVDPSVKDIASTEAPNKRPDVTTPEGVAAVREELDALHELFADAIASGRKTTRKRVNAEFGKGGTVLAKAALERGMIDRVSNYGATPTTNHAQASAPQGPNQTAADRLAAQLGSANKPGASESSAAFAERLLAGVKPPAPPQKPRVDIVAEIVLGERAVWFDVDPVTKEILDVGSVLKTPDGADSVDENPNSPAAQVADLVTAALRAQARGEIL